MPQSYREKTGTKSPLLRKWKRGEFVIKRAYQEMHKPASVIFVSPDIIDNCTLNRASNSES